MKKIIKSNQFSKAISVSGALSLSMTLVGCSAAPSESDIKSALNSSLQSVCPIASVDDVKKINGLEEVIEGNKYYSVELEYTVLLKYNSEWMGKYKDHLEKMKIADVEYEKAYSKAISVEESDVKDHVEKMNFLLEIHKNSGDELSALERSLRGMSPEDLKNADAQIDDLRAKQQAASNEMIDQNKYFNQVVAEKFRAILAEYSESIGMQAATTYKRLKYIRELGNQTSNSYRLPAKVSGIGMNPYMPEKCSSVLQGTASKVLGATFSTLYPLMSGAQPTATDFVEGREANLSMKALMRKSEKGWVFAN